ncbi:MAG: ABC transporter ATP-binding protein [Desulfobacterales bacterium]|nr:MAG: ABC transporter ATP-binding protein [Desulfobacterales bacterium]
MLKVDNLKVRYGAVTAVRDVSLEVAEGEMVSLLGANGSGKTTTMLAIAGALKAVSGKVAFNGEDITALSPESVLRKGIAMVPETREVFPDLTVRENLVMGGFIHRRNRQQSYRDLEQMLDLFPVLRERQNQQSGTLSGGEQQQLVIARAMMSRPKLLLLDEPSLGLAPAIVHHIYEFINKLRATGLTILLVEQNAKMALQNAERAYVMALGRIAKKGRAAEIAASSDLEALYLGG